jgi:hypothetical protein
VRTNPGHLFGANLVAAFRRHQQSDAGAPDDRISGEAVACRNGAPAAVLVLQP